MEAIIYLGLLALTWLIVEGAEPAQFIKRVLNLDFENKMPKKTIQIILSKLLACELCTGFWIGLGYYALFRYNDWFLLACLTSVGAELFARIINFIFNFVFNQWKK